ncbi:PRK06851 family protein [Peribacillus alkalitolerans]|uniref:PRK06851 family protein n=1 Tax=Peribacillus alkalitolerans TaxID=1550385 RepID=UPI001F07876A|nr:PRK06851 family protein [Peribacillus alkalitolerans]
MYMGKVLHYFASGNTAHGFQSLFDSNLAGLEHIYILIGGPGTGKSTMMKKIGNLFEEQGQDVEYLHCSADPHSLDGVLIRGLSLGIVDGTVPHVLEPIAPGAIEQYVNLGKAWDSSILKENKEEIIEMNSQIAQLYQEGYAAFREALAIHDDWEKIFIAHLDFNKMNDMTEELKEELFGSHHMDKESTVKHRFLGAATPYGAVDHVPNLTEEITRRYFIKGRPGSGKSTMLKKFAAEAEYRGLNVEVYHCGFDHNSLDMIIVRELGFAIFDSTAPHEYFPNRDGDSIVDVYERAIEPGTDERYSDELKTISSAYKNKMQEATAYLHQAKSLHDKIEKIYFTAMDFTVVDEIYNELLQEIEQLS